MTSEAKQDIYEGLSNAAVLSIGTGGKILASTWDMAADAVESIVHVQPKDVTTVEEGDAVIETVVVSREAVDWMNRAHEVVSMHRSGIEAEETMFNLDGVQVTRYRDKKNPTKIQVAYRELLRNHMEALTLDLWRSIPKPAIERMRENIGMLMGTVEV